MITKWKKIKLDSIYALYGNVEGTDFDCVIAENTLYPYVTKGEDKNLVSTSSYALSGENQLIAAQQIIDKLLLK